MLNIFLFRFCTLLAVLDLRELSAPKKILQKPLSFSYNPTSEAKQLDKIISFEQNLPRRKLKTRRILVPMRYYANANDRDVFTLSDRNERDSYIIHEDENLVQKQEPVTFLPLDIEEPSRNVNKGSLQYIGLEQRNQNHSAMNQNVTNISDVDDHQVGSNLEIDATTENPTLSAEVGTENIEYNSQEPSVFEMNEISSSNDYDTNQEYEDLPSEDEEGSIQIQNLSTLDENVSTPLNGIAPKNPLTGEVRLITLKRGINFDNSEELDNMSSNEDDSTSEHIEEKPDMEGDEMEDKNENGEPYSAKKIDETSVLNNDEHEYQSINKRGNPKFVKKEEMLGLNKANNVNNITKNDEFKIVTTDTGDDENIAQVVERGGQVSDNNESIAVSSENVATDSDNQKEIAKENLKESQESEKSHLEAKESVNDDLKDFNISKGSGETDKWAKYSRDGEREHGQYEDDRKYFENSHGQHGKLGNAGSHRDDKGDKKKIIHEVDYESGHHRNEASEKDMKFDENAEYEKGHKTKGTQNVHKEDVFDKKTEFYDDDYDSEDIDKFGKFMLGFKDDENGKYRKSKNSENNNDHKYAKNGNNMKKKEYAEEFDDKDEEKKIHHDSNILNSAKKSDFKKHKKWFIMK